MRRPRRPQLEAQGVCARCRRPTLRPEPLPRGPRPGLQSLGSWRSKGGPRWAWAAKMPWNSPDSRRLWRQLWQPPMPERGARRCWMPKRRPCFIHTERPRFGWTGSLSEQGSSCGLCTEPDVAARRPSWRRGSLRSVASMTPRQRGSGGGLRRLLAREGANLRCRRTTSRRLPTAPLLVEAAPMLARRYLLPSRLHLGLKKSLPARTARQTTTWPPVQGLAQWESGSYLGAWPAAFRPRSRHGPGSCSLRAASLGKASPGCSCWPGDPVRSQQQEAASWAGCSCAVQLRRPGTRGPLTLRWHLRARLSTPRVRTTRETAPTRLQLSTRGRQSRLVALAGWSWCQGTTKTPSFAPHLLPPRLRERLHSLERRRCTPTPFLLTKRMTQTTEASTSSLGSKSPMTIGACLCWKVCWRRPPAAAGAAKASRPGRDRPPARWQE
mmetsp:Transcript_21208/g.80980  ORF Transcript_21208/g.80980 Transcript_21208/m.80980 type:complete len:439 (-) Transcript_21208:2173-3489(-)